MAGELYLGMLCDHIAADLVERLVAQHHLRGFNYWTEESIRGIFAHVDMANAGARASERWSVGGREGGHATGNNEEKCGASHGRRSQKRCNWNSASFVCGRITVENAKNGVLERPPIMTLRELRRRNT